MLTPPEEAYNTSSPYVLEVFALIEPGGKERYNRVRAAWGEDADVEMLDLDHPVLIVRPGGARRWRCK
jgi:hypothetical protein